MFKTFQTTLQYIRILAEVNMMVFEEDDWEEGEDEEWEEEEW
jgi:hypothetical protein